MSLPPWVCNTCVDKMTLTWKFFSLVYSSYNSLSGGNGVQYLKKDMSGIKDGNLVIKHEPQEPQELCEQKLEENVPGSPAEERFSGWDLQNNSDANDDEDFEESDHGSSDEDDDDEVKPKKISKKLKSDSINNIKSNNKLNDIENNSDQKDTAKNEDEKYKNCYVFEKSSGEIFVKERLPHRKVDRKPRQKDGKIVTLKNRTVRTLQMKTLASMCTCAECNEQFQHTSRLETHWKSQHPGKEIFYKCVEEMDADNGCRFSTPYVQLMKNHLQQHMFDLGLMFKCDFCSKLYSKDHLLKHIKVVHMAEKKYECKICGSKYKTPAILANHELLHADDETRYKFSCDICGQRFTQRGNLDGHLATHSGDKPYKCPICDKAFSKMSNLTNHSLIHSSEKPFLCDQCDASFKTKYKLNTHVKVVHLKQLKYQCKYCPVEYNRMDLLKNHEMAHTGETPYKCATCGKGFRKKDRLRIHEVLHGSYEEKYIYPCEYCGRRFTQKNNLKTHIKSHHPEANLK